MQLVNLWQAHINDPFPDGCAGEEVHGVDLVMLDADTAGIVSHVIGGTPLTSDQRIILNQLIAEFDRVVPALTGHARQYFERLAAMSRLV
jgi:hypothetical protein